MKKLKSIQIVMKQLVNSVILLQCLFNKIKQEYYDY